MSTWVQILEQYRQLSDEPAVLATVVAVRGSAYRRPGARMLICPDGSRVGMISGGCLDKDVARNAAAWTAAGPRTVSYDTRGTLLEPQGPYGSGCDGVVDILLEPLGEGNVLDVVGAAFAVGETARFATCYASPSSSVGRRVAATQGAAAPAPVQAALERASTHRARTVLCGDERWLVEQVRPPVQLAVLGVGDDARPLVAAAAALGWEVRVAGASETAATRARFPAAARVVAGPVEGWLDALGVGPQTYVVVMTHSYRKDLTLLPQLLDGPAAWIGLMGPRSRTMGLMRELVERGCSPTRWDLARVQTPVGVDLGADEPEEVAMSVLAGLIAARNGRAGGLLRDRDGAIHPAAPDTRADRLRPRGEEDP